jgi:hypothetical protein
LGLLAGLALVTKYLAALLPLEILVLAIIKKRHELKAIGRGSNTQYAVRSNRQYAVSSTIHRWPIISLAQALVPFLLVVSVWFGYLIFNFNQIERYGPILGVLAPLIRGDASDRTAETIFAWLSGGQAPAPAYIEQQIYTAWQILAELPTTFWGNPIVRPYPLNWFVVVMTGVGVVSLAGLAWLWRQNRPARLWIGLMLFHCLLPVPFMLIRLFGARDALEAVQGRHILFIAGPAVAVLMVWGWGVVSGQWSVVSGQLLGIKGQGTEVRDQVSVIRYRSVDFMGDGLCFMPYLLCC